MTRRLLFVIVFFLAIVVGLVGSRPRSRRWSVR
jgi:hypothetical protein